MFSETGRNFGIISEVESILGKPVRADHFQPADEVNLLSQLRVVIVQRILEGVISPEAVKKLEEIVGQL